MHYLNISYLFYIYMNRDSSYTLFITTIVCTFIIYFYIYINIIQVSRELHVTANMSPVANVSFVIFIIIFSREIFLNPSFAIRCTKLYDGVCEWIFFFCFKRWAFFYIYDLSKHSSCTYNQYYTYAWNNMVAYWVVFFT